MKTPPWPGVGCPRLRARVTVAFVVLVLLLTTAQPFCLGIEDFSNALAFSGRITGAVLTVASFLTFPGAAAVLDYAAGPIEQTLWDLKATRR
ncbi:hypothetical protein [Streptomyces sp. IBSBF 3136]|uniref:hypothetical protein n=1 Tax=Streptomyces sp. IBSBF 3136 TaxID=2903524 RepID=UPI002FDBA0BE